MEGSYLCVFVLGLCCVAPVVWGQTTSVACFPGYYEQGGTCQQCSSGCVNQCNSENGMCSCKPDYHGDQCTSPCSSLSSRCTQCSQGGTCAACNGNFMAPACTDCAQGYYKQLEGGTCRQCSSGCVNNQCNRETGTCSCLPGKHGDLCDKACLSGNCLLNTCNQTTGRCLVCNTGFGGDTCSGCAPGYYRELGGECKQCSSGCKDNKCDDNTGKCDGCQPGYQGDQCTSLCSSRCTQCSQNGTCTVCNGQFMTPSCTEAQGETTTQQAENESDTEKLIVPVVGSIVGVGLLLTISLTAAVCWINRKREHSEFTAKKENYYSTPDPVLMLSNTERGLPELPSSSPSSENSEHTEPKTIHTGNTGNDYTHPKTIHTGNTGNDYTHPKTIHTGNTGNDYTHPKSIHTGNTDDDYTHPKTINTGNTDDDYTRPLAVQTINTDEKNTQINTVRTESPDRQDTQPKTSFTQDAGKQGTEDTDEDHIYSSIDTEETKF